jgi:hypothetical protein
MWTPLYVPDFLLYIVISVCLCFLDMFYIQMVVFAIMDLWNV